MSSHQRRIVIIGGGIIGCTSAYYLTRHPRFIASTKNMHITLLEASTIAGGASGKAGGLVANWAYPRELTEISFEEHKKLADMHGGKERWGWREVSCAHWKGRTRAAEGRASVGTSASGDGTLHGPRKKARGVTRFLPEDLDWVDDALTDSYESIGGPGETAQVHPYEFTTSMLALAREAAGENLQVLEGAKVTSIERASATGEQGSDDGKGDRVVGVTYTTTAGSPAVHIPADFVLLAAGPWSPTLLPSLSITASRSHSIVIEPASPLSPHVLFTTISSPDAETAAPEIYARPHNRAYACGPGDDAPLPPLASLVQPSKSITTSLREQVASISVPLRDGRVEVEQACYMPLGGPIVGAVDGVRGLIVATGHTCWGICNAPGTAKAVAELMMDERLGKQWKLNKLEPRRFLKK